MSNTALLLTVLLGLTSAQLNYEGSPLTENTEYTAEESHFSQRTARTDEEIVPQKLYKVSEPDNLTSNSTIRGNVTVNYDKSAALATVQNSTIAVAHTGTKSARYIPMGSSIQGRSTVNQAQYALSSFLNSKTPEESRQSLDQYLQTSKQSNTQPLANNVLQNQMQQAQPVQQVQQVYSQSQQQGQMTQAQSYHQSLSPSDQASSQLNTQLYQQHVGYPVASQQQQLLGQNERIYHQSSIQALPNAVAGPVMFMPQPVLQKAPYMAGSAAGLQSRGDFYPPGWHNPMRRIRGKPYPFSQARLGPVFYKGPPSGPIKKGPPIEVIYTKPPGFHHQPGPISNPPVPYESASAYFPEVDYAAGPPPTKDVYYSQLYAQSYDPHYYNYIAKTGKIKPYLYGKLGQHKQDDEGSGIWAELFRGFKKHGLKNMMTPSFLLGMTLPVVTLMLTALVQKRSLGRSDGREFSREDQLQEYFEIAQRAMECYEKKWRKGEETNADEC